MLPIAWAAAMRTSLLGVDPQFLQLELQSRVFELLLVGQALAFDFHAGLLDADLFAADR